MSEKILVRPTELYSGSIYCKTSDYTKFDGIDPQIVVQILGYETPSGSPIVLKQSGVNKEDFPAQDWFRIKIENIQIPSNIHYISLKAHMVKNGEIWFTYPCIEYGDKTTDWNPYNTDLMSYYNQIIYGDILDIQELTKSENLS